MSTLSHAEALPIVREAWRRVHGREPTENEAVLTMAVAALETNYGRAGQHGRLAAEGKYNWANLEKPRAEGADCPAGWAPGKDDAHHVCFQVFPSDIEAAAALVKNLTKRHWPVLDAMALGSATAVANAMKASPAYYAAPASAYAAGLERFSADIRRALGLSSPATPVGPIPGHGTLPSVPTAAQAAPVLGVLLGAAVSLGLLGVAFDLFGLTPSRR